MTIEFLITTFIVVVSPGTGVLYTLAAELTRGSRASIVAAFGCTLASMLMLSSVFMLMTFVVFVGYGLLAASIRDHVISRPRVLTWMRRTFAAAFVALGAKLAVADR